MSASSSSDCECDLYYNNYRTYTPIQPLYPELGHPLIYYTQVQKKQWPQQSGKNKNNCFAKAFRWYTEEHVSLRKTDSGTKNTENQGFATWLDQKYDEYVRKSQITKMFSSQYLLKPTTSGRSNKLGQNNVYETSAPRKKKMRSPWRRRQRNLNKQNGDTIKKSEQSIEFILNPKNLSRSASEFCQKCHRSNNAITTDTNSKSESLIYIVKEKEMYVVPLEDKDKATDKKNCNDGKINVNNGQLKGKTPTKNISCQCSIVKFDNVDASSQMSHKTSNVASSTNGVNKRPNYINACCPCVESQPGINQKVLIDQNAPLPTVHSSAVSQKSVQNIHSAIVTRETSFAVDKYIGKNEHSFSVNAMAQTSDQAINLFNIINPENQMFLQIICAHK